MQPKKTTKDREEKPIEEIKPRPAIETETQTDSFSELVLSTGDEMNSDSYFKSVVTNLMDTKNPSTKTEYRNVAENFTGAKLTFLALYGNIPLLSPFVDIFEIKRISLERKSRKELIMALVEREQEVRRQAENRTRGLLGI